MSPMSTSWRHPRRPTEVTADRLREHLDRYFDFTDGQIRDDVSRIIDWLERMAAPKADR